MKTEKIIRQEKRQKRVRSKMVGTTKRPRLSVFRSGKHIYAQLIDDVKSVTLISASDLELVKKEKTLQSKKDVAREVGDIIAKKALKKKIKRVIFDRGGFKYHGRVAAIAEGARKGGLEL